MSLTIAINNSLADTSYPAGAGSSWITVAPGTDYIIFTNGSVAVADGQAIPSSFQLGSAGIVLNGITQVVPHYLLASVGANLLYEAKLMGSGNHRYVMAFSFSTATTSEPVLEAWDNTSMNSYNDNSLGAGTPSNSWLHGIQTTTGSAGASWTGVPMAGSGAGYFVWLNNQAGALSGATVLYCQLQMIVPSTQTSGGAETPILVVKYTTT